MPKPTATSSLVSRNKRAYHHYEIIDKMEAGIVLLGSEVKSIREGHLTLSDAYARVIKGELWLCNCHISAFKFNTLTPVDPRRERKLLVHKRQLDKIFGKAAEKGLTIIPLSVYFTRNKVKVEIGVAKPKKLFDKRHAIKDRDVQRDLQRSVKQY